VIARVICAARRSLGEVDQDVFLKEISWMSLPAGTIGNISKSDEFVIPKLIAYKILSSLKRCKTLDEARVAILLSSRPNWLLGWRKITNTTNSRTIIASAFPAVGSTDSLYLVRTGVSADLSVCLMAQWLSLVADYVCRNKLGGTNLSYGYFNQLPVVGPDGFKDADLMFLVPRILELIYTANDMVGFYDDVILCNAAYDSRVSSERGKPYKFDVDRRLFLKCELDAYIAHMWGLTRDELRFVLDPKEIMGANYPSETFRGLRDAEIKQFGEYRTQRLVLEAWDRIVEPLRRRQG
jgi:hypothetical protein